MCKNVKFKKLIIGNLKRKSGKNYSGKKTIRNRGFILKQNKRLIDYFRAFWNVKSCILNFEYSPCKKNSLINLILYFNGVFCYLTAVEGSYVGMFLENGVNARLATGNNLLLLKIPKNFKFSNLEINLYKGSQISRNSCSFAKILSKNSKICLIKLKSKKLKKVNLFCTATLGIIFNFNFFLKKYKKAGYSRLGGFRPKVRGVAMNPVDHPHGGGEGKKSKKMDPRSPWGKKLNFRKK